MSVRDSVLEFNEEAAILPEEFDEAIIGMAERINLGPVVAYSVDKIIDILSPQMIVDVEDLEDGQTIEMAQREMAVEHFGFNIKGSWVGEGTPVFVEKLIEI